MHGADDQYKHCHQLLALEACARDRKVVVPDYVCVMATPLKLEAWQEALRDTQTKPSLPTSCVGLTRVSRSATMQSRFA